MSLKIFAAAMWRCPAGAFCLPEPPSAGLPVEVGIKTCRADESPRLLPASWFLAVGDTGMLADREISPLGLRLTGSSSEGISSQDGHKRGGMSESSGK